MSQSKLLLSGLTVGLILSALNQLDLWLASGLRAMGQTFELPFQMPALGWGIVVNLLIGLLFTLGFHFVRRSLPDHGLAQGVQYGFWVWLVGIVPGFLQAAVFLQAGWLEVIAWMLFSMVNSVLLGLLVASLLPEDDAAG